MSFFLDPTILNVIIGASFLGIISGVLGSFAVLRKQSLLGDALSHAALPGICIGFLIAGTRSLPAILIGALLAGAAAALIILALTRATRLKTDAALGIVLSVFFALGVVLLTAIQNTGSAAQAGLESFLFGQAAAILRTDLYVMGGVTFAALALVVLLWKELKAVTFDPVFARTIGLPVLVLEIVLTTMIALAVVVGLQMVGVVLMAAMIIAPAVAARQWTNRLEAMVILSALFGMIAGVFGALVSATARGLATGPLIVLGVSAIVAISLLAAPERGLLWDHFKRRDNARQLRGHRVLATLYRLAAEHSDPAYPSEQTMIDAYYGQKTAPVLARLEARGLVAPTEHQPEGTPHWALTEAGIAEAERLNNQGAQA